MKFNPIKDLTPFARNKAVKQLGGVTDEEISNLSSGLRDTSLRTSAIADQLRRDFSLLKRDLDKIRDLDRRLKRVIPIIPGQGAVAGNIFPEDKPGPDGGLNIPIPKFPKIPPFIPPVNQPQPQPQPQTQEQTQEETKPQPQYKPLWQRLWDLIPDIEIPDIPIPPLIPPRLPDFEGIPGLAYGGIDTVNAIAAALPGQVNDITKSIGFDFSFAKDRSKLEESFAKLPEQIKAEQEKQAKASFFENLRNPNFIMESIALQQTFGNLGRPGRDSFGDLAMQSKLGSRLSKFARGLRSGRRPQMNDDDMRRYLEAIGLDRRVAKLNDKNYFPGSPGEIAARRDVLGEIASADETFERITSGATASRITKRTPSKIDIKSFFDDIASGEKTIGTNTIADIVGFRTDPELRKRFLYYLRQAPRGQKEQNPEFLKKIAKGLELLPNGTQDDKNVAIQTLMRFLRPSGPNVKDSREFLFQKLKQADKFADDVPFEDFLTKGESQQLRLPGIEEMLEQVLKNNVNSSMIGKPRSMDIASLGIDTSVEIQEIYYIVG